MLELFSNATPLSGGLEADMQLIKKKNSVGRRIVTWTSSLTGVDGRTGSMEMSECEEFIKKEILLGSPLDYSIKSVPPFPAFYWKNGDGHTMVSSLGRFAELAAGSTDVLKAKKIGVAETMLGNIPIYGYETPLDGQCLSDLFSGHQWCHLIDWASSLKAPKSIIWGEDMVCRGADTPPVDISILRRL